MSDRRRAAFYIRTRLDTSGDGLRDLQDREAERSRQHDICVRIAQGLGATLHDKDDEYVDHRASATNLNRPGLRRLLRRLEEYRDVDVVIVAGFDRLARNVYDFSRIAEAITGAGAELESADGKAQLGHPEFKFVLVDRYRRAS